MSGCQPADPSTYNHAIEGFSGRLRTLELPGIKCIPDAVTCGHDRMSIPVCCGVVAHTAVAIPILLSHHGRAARRVGSEWTSIEEIGPGYLGVHAKRAVC